MAIWKQAIDYGRKWVLFTRNCGITFRRYTREKKKPLKNIHNLKGVSCIHEGVPAVTDNLDALCERLNAQNIDFEETPSLLGRSQVFDLNPKGHTFDSLVRPISLPPLNQTSGNHAELF